MFKRRCSQGGIQVRDIFALFKQSNWVIIKEENKIRHGLRWPPNDGYHQQSTKNTC
jgi:hypothetical protein